MVVILVSSLGLVSFMAAKSLENEYKRHLDLLKTRWSHRKFFESWGGKSIPSLKKLLQKFPLEDQVKHLCILTDECHWQNAESQQESKARRFSKDDATYSAIRAEMLSEGWCKSTIYMLTRIGIDGLHYAKLRFKTRFSSSVEKHVNCTESQCVGLTVTEKTYQQRHRGDCKQENCHAAQVDSEMIAQMIKQGDNPRIVLPTDHGDLDPMADFTLKAATEGPYIAISHVWAHGLGNPDQNSIPRCRVLELLQGIQQVEKTRKKSSQSNIAIWMDTWCVPVPAHLKETRKMTIQRLDQIYRDAVNILVVDADIAQMSSKDPMIDLTMAVLCSDWMRRLWTLQEAVLASRASKDRPESSLIFQLRDGIINLGDVIPNFAILKAGPLTIPKEEPEAFAPFQDKAEWALKNALTEKTEYTLVTCQQRKRRNRFIDVDVLGNDYFWRLLLNISFRGVTRPLDESTCIATLLGVDLNTVMDSISPGERTLTILKHMKNIPLVVVYSDAPRYGIQPYTWAPTTLIESWVPPDTSVEGAGLGHISEKGLVVEVRGVELDLSLILRSEDIIFEQDPFPKWGVNENTYWEVIGTSEPSSPSSVNHAHSFAVQRPNLHTHARLALLAGDFGIPSNRYILISIHGSVPLRQVLGPNNRPRKNPLASSPATALRVIMQPALAVALGESGTENAPAAVGTFICVVRLVKRDKESISGQDKQQTQFVKSRPLPNEHFVLT